MDLSLSFEFSAKVIVPTYIINFHSYVSAVDLRPSGREKVKKMKSNTPMNGPYVTKRSRSPLVKARDRFA